MHQNLPTEWDLSPLFAGDDDPRIPEERERARTAAAAFAGRWKGCDDWLHDPSVLAQALAEYEEWVSAFGGGGAEGFYASLRSAIDESPARKAAFNRMRAFALELENGMAFFHLRLARVPKETRRMFLAAEVLAPWHGFLGRLFLEAPFLRSEDEERILNAMRGPAHEDWVRMVSGRLALEQRLARDEQGERKPRGMDELLSLLQSTSKGVRDEAARLLNGVLKTYAPSAEAEMNAILEHKRAEDEIRGTGRPDLARHLADGIETETVDLMLEAVEKQFSIAQRFYRLKADILGVPVLAYHERNVKIGEAEGSYPYEDAVRIVQRVFGSLDLQFAGILEELTSRGRVDVYPKKGKRGGAFCASALPAYPVYILLNHTGKLRDVLTLAHEAGHGIHDELMKKGCSALDFGTSLATAEVASTFMEDFVLRDLMGRVDEEARFAMMMEKLNDEVSTIFRQAACYRFEQDLHDAFRQEGYLSKERIGSLFQARMGSYMGRAVEQSPGSENWWVYWSHIRRFFYVYSYASGLLISKSLQRSVREDTSFMNKVKAFLAAGLSAPPRELFLRLGIDIASPDFWEKGLEETEVLLTEAEGLAKRLKKV